MPNTLSKNVSYLLAALALAASALLLASDANLWAPAASVAAPVSSAPLLLVGVAFLVLQLLLRPRLPDLVKNFLLAITFLLWGAVQLMPQTDVSRRLGDLVIALYVVDLAWTIFATKRPAGSE